MRFLLTIHLILGLSVTALLALVLDERASLSFAAGSGLMLVNFAIHGLVWPLILGKKLFALSIGVIVFKFAILAWILNMVATGDSLQSGWFAVGISLVVVSAVITAFKEAAQSQR